MNTFSPIVLVDITGSKTVVSFSGVSCTETYGGNHIECTELIGCIILWRLWNCSENFVITHCGNFVSVFILQVKLLDNSNDNFYHNVQWIIFGTSLFCCLLYHGSEFAQHYVLGRLLS